MSDGGRLNRFLRTKLRGAGREFADAKRQFDDARAAARADLPLDDEGRARLVCRRHADRRAISLDDDLRPSCFDPDHPDCRGCLEDVRAGRVETW